MTKTIQVIFVSLHFLFFSIPATANIFPGNGASLNFTQVMFEYDEAPGATTYVITIRSADPGENRMPIVVENSSLAVMISEGLAFGKNYTWNYEAFIKEKSIFKSADFSFSIKNYFLVDSSRFRTIIFHSDKALYHDDLVLLDYTGTIIDRKGRPVWFFPYIPKDGASAPNFRNMRMTQDGTITYQDANNCYEVDLTGNIIWQAPNDGQVSGAPSEFYHHDFRKLNDGTYLTCSYQFADEPNLYNPSLITKVRYNTMIQYDAQGAVLWSWNEKDHVSKDIIFKGYAADAASVEGTHMNGFDYDYKNDGIVMSFRNNSSIIRIDKKTGNVIYALGIDTPGHAPGNYEFFFAKQHGPQVLPDGQILVYNNNVKDSGGPSFPHIEIFNEPVNGRPASIAWDYEFRPHGYIKGLKGKEGYAMMLPNKNILVCTGTGNSSCEVTPDKQMVWEAVFERYDDAEKKWTGFNNYRTTFTTSLYPFYYTLQHDDRRNIQINNEGASKDEYIISILEDGKQVGRAVSVTIEPRTAAVYKIPLKGNHDHVTVVVTPGSNRSVSKYLSFDHFPFHPAQTAK
jgi:hypothetical protein